MATIEQLKKTESGVERDIYPITTPNAVRDEDGVSLDVKLQQKYTMPQTGIPATDLESGVQTTLGKVTDLESQVGNKEDKNIIDSDTSTTAVSEALVVGKTYKYMPSAGVATLAFTLTVPTETDVVKFWRFKFKSGATATEFTPPSGLYWANGDSLVPEANTIYEVMIDEDYCVSVLAFKQATA